MKEKGRIVNSGVGGFLNPPNHPEHDFSVEIDLRRRKENRGSINLSYALTEDYIDDATKAKAKACLESWVKLPLTDPIVIDWIHQCHGYFGAGSHRAVDHIKKYYPEYTLIPDHIENAYWGSKT